MADSFKDIIITPYRANTADPKFDFRGANSTVNTTITLTVYPDSNGTLSFDGSAGQLFSITNDLSGILWSVNDISGIPSAEVDASGHVRFAQFGGNVSIGTANNTYKLEVNGDTNITGNIRIGGNTVVNSAGYWVGNLAGLTGFTGSIGATGFTGSIGATGFTGSIGTQGTQGVIGFTGSKGDTGTQGVIGYTGSQGVIGYTGSKGDTGTQGATGFTGSKGDIGFTGSIGGTGFTGSVGFTGSIGATGFTGSGTVTSVGLSLPTQFSVTGSPVTGAGTLTAAWVAVAADGSQGRVLSGPNAGSAVPTFRNLTETDIPTLSQAKITNLTTDLTAKANLASPTFTGTPVLTTTTTVGASGPVVGYRDIPITIQNATYTFALADAGKGFGKDNTTAYTYTIPANGTVAFPVGTAITVFNNNTTSSITIAITTDTLRLGGTTTTGSRTLAPFGVCTLLKVASTVWIASGAGLT